MWRALGLGRLDGARPFLLRAAALALFQTVGRSLALHARHAILLAAHARRAGGLADTLSLNGVAVGARLRARHDEKNKCAVVN